MTVGADKIGLPSQVAQQAEEVQRYFDSLQEGGKTAEATPVQPATGELPAETPAASAVVMEGEPGQQQQAATEIESTDYQHAYQVLQGKYNAEVPRLNQRIRQLESENEQLRGTLASQPPAGQQPSSYDDAGAGLETLTIEQLEERLDDASLEGNMELCRTIRAAIRSRDRQEIMREFEPIRETVTLSRDERYVTELNSMSPGWDKLRNDPGFAEFVRQAPQFSDQSYGDILRDADQRRDAVRVSAVYNAFKSTMGITQQPAAQQQPAGIPAHMMAPPRSGGPSGPTPTAPRITEQNLKQAADDYCRGAIGKAEYDTILESYRQQAFG